MFVLRNWICVIVMEEEEEEEHSGRRPPSEQYSVNKKHVRYLRSAKSIHTVHFPMPGV